MGEEKEAVIKDIKRLRDKTGSKNGSRKRSEIKLGKAQRHYKSKEDCIRLILI